MESIKRLLLCRSQKHNKREERIKIHKMRIQDFLQRVVVIDNIEEEANGIKNALEPLDISVDIVNLENIPKYNHNRQLIFADLLLDEDISNLITNISRLIGIISRIQGENFGPYGLVVWTKHDERIYELLDRLNRAVYKTDEDDGNNTLNANEDEEVVPTTVPILNPPLFVTCLSKAKYKMPDGSWDFTGVLNNLNQELENSTAASFFFTWYSSVQKATLASILNIFNISHDYRERDAQIKYLLMNLAHNETGSKLKDHNLTMASYKAFDALLNSELYSIVRDIDYPDFSNFDDKPFGADIENLQRISSKLNSKMFIDDQNLNQEEILPGNVYLIKKDSPLIIRDEDRMKIKVQKESGTWADSNDYSCEYIAVELTPPCDASHKKIYSRLIGGYIFDMPLGINPNGKKKSVLFHEESSDKRYVLYPIMLEKKVKVLILEYRYLWTPKDEELKDEEKYKLAFKLTQPLFADILQKFSSHASRLGLSSINLAEESF